MSKIQDCLYVSETEKDKVCRSAGVYYAFHKEEIAKIIAKKYDFDEIPTYSSFWTDSTKLFYTLWALWNACDNDLTFFGSFNGGDSLVEFRYYDFTFDDFVTFFKGNERDFRDGVEKGEDLIKRYGQAE